MLTLIPDKRILECGPSSSEPGYSFSLRSIVERTATLASRLECPWLHSLFEPALSIALSCYLIWSALPRHFSCAYPLLVFGPRIYSCSIGYTWGRSICNLEYRMAVRLNFARYFYDRFDLEDSHSI